jgi:hypothetical protein
VTQHVSRRSPRPQVVRDRRSHATQRGQDSTAWVNSGSRSVRKPRGGCGVFGIPEGVRYLPAQCPTLHRTRPRRSRPRAHGPCHRPACPFCGSRIGDSRQLLAGIARSQVRWTVSNVHHENRGFSNDHGGDEDGESGVKVNAIHAWREQRGTPSLRQSGVARRRRDSLAVSK